MEADVCAALGIRNSRHRSGLHSLESERAANLAELVYGRIKTNWLRSSAGSRVSHSRQNWRWCSIQPQISAANRSPEVVLERAIAGACLRQGRSDWANQIPVASGLVAGAGDARRAIDLVHKLGSGHFEFLEFKIASDTPLYAAVEIISYASLWLLTRAEPLAHQTELVTAEHIDLRVLAPAGFYAPFRLAHLEKVLDHSVRRLARDNGIAMTFGFQALHYGLLGFPPPPDQSLLDLLGKREPLHRLDA